MKRKNESGFVAIFSVLIIMSILTLVTIGYSNVTRDAQRRTIDSQLDTQAFYAAESGVNDAIKYIESAASADLAQKTGCQDNPIGGDAGQVFSGYDTSINSNLQTGYSCVIIDNVVKDLIFSSVSKVGTGSPKVVPIEPSNGGVVSAMTISWEDPSGNTRINDTSDVTYPNILRGTTGWGDGLGILRLDIVPVNNLNRGTLIDSAYTFFLYPSVTAAGSTFTVGNGPDSQGGLIPVDCPSATSACTARLTLGGSSSTKYVMRLQSIYNDTKVTISNLTTTSGETTSFRNAQYMVDVTGRANDVFRRVQVRLPQKSNGRIPDFALLTSDSLCKRILVSESGSTVDGNGVGSDLNTACALE